LLFFPEGDGTAAVGVVGVCGVGVDGITPIVNPVPAVDGCIINNGDAPCGDNNEADGGVSKDTDEDDPAVVEAGGTFAI
jgi:hypothetical protein